MSVGQITRNEIFQLIFRVSIASVITFYSLKWMMNQLDPTNKSKKKARDKAEEQIRRLNMSDGLKLSPTSLSEYELVIASHLVVPEDIKISWADIGGLKSIIQGLRETVILPIRHRKLFTSSQLMQAPKGVLLYGPPGCGKTLIAKATAKEAGMRFINLDVAILTDKWYGESQKLASAVFSLARKLQPCIIFIDEIDSFLRSRNAQDHEATAMMKTQFMMLWDGLDTEASSTVIVMGATNRPQDLDNAILRRMTVQFRINLPEKDQRLEILRLILGKELLASNVDLDSLAEQTTRFSGSDLRELCRTSSIYRMREFVKQYDNLGLGANSSSREPEPQSPPPISMENLNDSLKTMRNSNFNTGLLSVESRIGLD